MLCLLLGVGLIGLTLGWPALSRSAQDDLQRPYATLACIAAAAKAARAEDVPLDVLLTVALVESGRDIGAGVAPWAWAVHERGRGHWPAHRADALAIAQAARADGVTNIDLGCFQINLHWHGAQFSGLDAMLDPDTNARYAARLLRGHFDRTGTWDAAVGAYHSRTPDLAAAYLARFARLSAHVSGLLPITDTPRQIFPATAGGIALHLATDTRPLLDLRGRQP
jgi:hypothetical protein